MSTTVLSNVILRGKISGEKRQIDVLVESRWFNDVSKRIIVDAKYRTGKIDINDVESFEGMMRDCDASRGVIVCTAGYTKGAHRRAQDKIAITLLTLEEALQFHWVCEPCYGNCTQLSQGSQIGMVLWGAHLLPQTTSGLWLVVQTGTCDKCHSFHVWCWDCGRKFAVPDTHVIACDCPRFWSSVPESEASGHIGRPESIWLLMREDFDSHSEPVPLDRKPITV